MAPAMKTAIASLSLLVASSSAWSIPSILQRSGAAEPPNPKYGRCDTNGALVCNGATQFGLCNYGSVVWQDVAAGTMCEDGEIVTLGDVKCETPGALLCHGPSMFGLCQASGYVQWQAVAAGTFCQNGQIVAAGSYATAVPTRLPSNNTNATSAAAPAAVYTIPGSAVPPPMPTTIPGSAVPMPLTKRSAPSTTTSTAQTCITASTASTGYLGGDATATLDAGVVVGTTTSFPAATATINKFLGVPFAAAPVRFSPPEKPQSWAHPIDAKEYKPACIQEFVYPKVQSDFTQAIFNNPAPQESEDCLYLNVFAPSSPAPADGRPVLFWIYGGALEFGNAGNPYYDGSILAAYQDVIVVTINYRTNVFGFATSDEIPLAERNLGFLDQRMALDWVQRNIAAFGGSPYKVTLFGESAGAFSIDALLTSYDKGSCPPFRGAILQSGQISYRSTPNPSTVPAWNQLAAAFNCPAQGSVECLRKVAATDIKKYIEENSLTFNYAFDEVTAYSNGAARREQGLIARIPILIGSNSQEGRIFEVGKNSQEATREFVNQISGDISAYGDKIEAAFALGSPGISSHYDQLSQIFTDYVFQCPAAKVAKASAASGIPAWRYYFNASFPNTQAYPDLGVYHSSEIPLVFGTYPRTNVTTQQYALSTSMMAIWARFAKNPKGGPGWNPVGTGVANSPLSVGMSVDESGNQKALGNGMASSALNGVMDIGMGGMYIDESGMPVQGAHYLAVLGNRGDSPASGVTVINQQEVDYRCALFEPTYQAILAGAGT